MLSDKILEITMAMVDENHKFSFAPGQWISIIAQHNNAEIQSEFSISSDPKLLATKRQVQIVTQVTGNQKNPMIQYLLYTVQVGDRLRIKGGGGTSYYRTPSSASLMNDKSREWGRHIVLIGGGVGISPLLSILRHVYTMPENKKNDYTVTVLLSVKSPADILYKNELISINRSHKNFNILCTFTESERLVHLNNDISISFAPQDSIKSKQIGKPSDSFTLLGQKKHTKPAIPTNDKKNIWVGWRGRIDVDHLKNSGATKNSKNAMYFVCGKPEFVEHISSILQDTFEVDYNRICYDKWW
jgi:ferredoxin-NADP reductase